MKKHKEESGCSGVRDKTAFVALSKMDEMNLLSGETLPLLCVHACVCNGQRFVDGMTPWKAMIVAEGMDYPG